MATGSPRAAGVGPDEQRRRGSARSGCTGAAPGTTTRGSCARRAASRSRARSATTTSGSGWLEIRLRTSQPARPASRGSASRRGAGRAEARRRPRCAQPERRVRKGLLLRPPAFAIRTTLGRPTSTRSRRPRPRSCGPSQRRRGLRDARLTSSACTPALTRGRSLRRIDACAASSEARWWDQAPSVSGEACGLLAAARGYGWRPHPAGHGRDRVGRRWHRARKGRTDPGR